MTATTRATHAAMPSEAAARAAVEAAQQLDDLPVGSVVMARHARYGDVWPWSRTDDTELCDEDGHRYSRAWCCVAYTGDRTSAGLLAESSSVAVVWNGDTDTPEKRGAA